MPTIGPPSSEVTNLEPHDTNIFEEWKKIGSYTPAEKPKMQPQKQQIIFLVLLLVDFVKGLILTLPIIFKSFLELFVPPKPKIIKGDVALVTGGGNGLGRAMAIELAKRGAKVAICDLDVKAGEETVNILKELKGQDYQARSYKADVADPSSINKLRDKIIDDFEEPVSILINNAGLMPSVSIINGADDDYRKVVDVNLLSHFWCIRAFLPAMKNRNHGHVVLISSMAGFYGMRGAGVYSATKFALRGLAESLADELDATRSSVRVTCVHPYFIATRKIMMEHIDVRIPALEVETAASEIIEGVCRNYTVLAVPGHMLFSTRIMNLLPYEALKIIKNIFSVKIKVPFDRKTN